MQSTVDSGLGAGGGPAAPSDHEPEPARAAVSADINGEVRRFEVAGGTTLLTALREALGLTAAKEGCGQGDCGSCIVFMNGEPVNSCLVLAAEADGSTITTLEGLADGEQLHPLQQEFCDRWAFQCGYCTPGMVMSCFALLSINADPSEAEVREAIEGNLCRCTNYRPIVEATLAAAARLREPGGG